MFNNITLFLDELILEIPAISDERKIILNNLAKYIQSKIDAKTAINLVYICTHNSRRSHFGQVAAVLSASYFGIENVHSFSGGTEKTAMHPNAISALKKIGFEIQSENQLINPLQVLNFGEEKEIFCFSKLYDDTTNPRSNFAAIMTCSDAEKNCPFISGAKIRIGTTYLDPKSSDGTPQESQTYLDRFKQITRENLYVFSSLKK